MSAMEITRLFEKIKALENRVKALEEKNQRQKYFAPGPPCPHCGKHEPECFCSFDPAHYSTDPDRLIVERWKAGGCLFCTTKRPLDLNYCCTACYKANRDVAPSQVEEFIRLKALCDAAVKEGK